MSSPCERFAIAGWCWTTVAVWSTAGKNMTFRNKLLLVLMVLSGIMIFLTYTPSDSRYFWTYWCTVWVLLSLGYMMDVLFASSNSFVFDPNPENWRRRTDPQS